MDPDKSLSYLDAGLPETRSVSFIDFESKDDGWGFEGLASVYGEPADLGDFTEEFQRGAYRRPLARGDNVRLIYDHSPPHVPILATLGAKTMEIKDDVKGIVVRAQIAKHYMGEAARELIRRGDIKGMSPGFVVGKGNSSVEMRGNKPHRIIKDLQRFLEVSITPDPAYAGTTAEVRALRAMAESMEATQQVLSGAHQQPEDGAPPPEVGAGDEEAKTDEEREAEEAAREAFEQEQRFGVDTAKAESAARKRRLQMMGLSLPRRDL